MFRRKKAQPTLPNSPVTYPPATFVETETGYWYIKSDRRLKILSKRVLDSYSPARVVKTTDKAIALYPYKMGKLGFRSNTLIYNIKDGSIYLVSDNVRRRVTSPDVLTRLGATKDDIMVVSDEEIKLHSEGADIS